MKRSLLLVTLVAAAGCGGGSSKHDTSCDPTKVDACSSGQVCEQVQGGTTACVAPVQVQGVVFDLAKDRTTGPIQDARVVPLDVNGAPLGSAATTATNGSYTVRVPAVRDTSGKPISAGVTLRADAMGYATFPSGIRSAVPLDLGGATLANGVYTLSSSLTDVGLIVDSTAGTGKIHGAVAGVTTAGALVVAEQSGIGHTGVADSSGHYVIFNLPVGDWSVQAYAKGMNHAPQTVAGLAANDDRLADIPLGAAATATVTGSIQPTGQNQPATLDTSVILVVQSTYDLAIDRGESPPGLVVPNLTQTAFSLAGVPDGKYTILAAFGNDGYVRDVSGIGGTAPVDVEVVNGVMTSTPGSFKITGAVSFAAGGGITPSTGTDAGATLTNSLAPIFTWVAYPSLGTGSYHVTVFDALGTPIWTPAPIPAGTTSVTYSGPPLVANMTYQVRITAFDTGANQISRTEDLLGVFTYRP